MTSPLSLSGVHHWPITLPPGRLQIPGNSCNGSWGSPIFNQFIRRYSTIATPLNSPTSSKVPFCWSQAVKDTFQHLKARFTYTHILIIPDSSRQFIVVVDASDVGVGAVLSAEDQKIHPCAFFSRICLQQRETMTMETEN